ncbi:src kinase-associated phosphoprotein 2 isoform X1 [Numida meleagris]|uniref:src kinase-associated phosphoprotein 2 isoform X1 n=2 Tax=Numida meleagris TaxID=8996 RepID=UPI000B3DA023|nr:src kinase-associated phosphoprotein 2 isoform X1 [Numida meleagris]
MTAAKRHASFWQEGRVRTASSRNTTSGSSHVGGDPSWRGRGYGGHPAAAVNIGMVAAHARLWGAERGGQAKPRSPDVKLRLSARKPRLGDSRSCCSGRGAGLSLPPWRGRGRGTAQASRPRGAPVARSMHGAAIPEDVRGLLADVDTFISQTLKGENLSKKAKEKKDTLLKKIKDVKASYPQEFQDKELEDEEESESSFSSPPDSASIASDRYDKEDEPHSDGNQFPPIAAQDLQFVLKAGYLEKRRKDHSFLGFEWQKRWCAISKTVFYYYGSDKDKQQKGEFALEGYTIRMNNSLRKDAKKDCCFEISAPDKRIYQFTAATPKEAEEWVQQVKFVIQDMESNTIPEEEEEYDDVGHASSEPIDDSIYEELPEENAPPKTEVPRKWSQEKVATASDGKNTDYANFYQGLWDCTGDVPDELTFKRGDVIYILSKEYNRFGWWVGEMKGTVGLVPKAYIMEMYDI